MNRPSPFPDLRRPTMTRELALTVLLGLLSSPASAQPFVDADFINVSHLTTL